MAGPCTHTLVSYFDVFMNNTVHKQNSTALKLDATLEVSLNSTEQKNFDYANELCFDG